MRDNRNSRTQKVNETIKETLEEMDSPQGMKLRQPKRIKPLDLYRNMLKSREMENERKRLENQFTRDHQDQAVVEEKHIQAYEMKQQYYLKQEASIHRRRINGINMYIRLYEYKSAKAYMKELMLEIHIGQKSDTSHSSPIEMRKRFKRMASKMLRLLFEGQCSRKETYVRSNQAKLSAIDSKIEDLNMETLYQEKFSEWNEQWPSLSEKISDAPAFSEKKVKSLDFSRMTAKDYRDLTDLLHGRKTPQEIAQSAETNRNDTSVAEGDLRVTENRILMFGLTRAGLENVYDKILEQRHVQVREHKDLQAKFYQHLEHGAEKVRLSDGLVLPSEAENFQQECLNTFREIQRRSQAIEKLDSNLQFIRDRAKELDDSDISNFLEYVQNRRQGKNKDNDVGKPEASWEGSTKRRKTKSKRNKLVASDRRQGKNKDNDVGKPEASRKGSKKRRKTIIEEYRPEAPANDPYRYNSNGDGGVPIPAAYNDAYMHGGVPDNSNQQHASSSITPYAYNLPPIDLSGDYPPRASAAGANGANDLTNVQATAQTLRPNTSHAFQSPGPESVPQRKPYEPIQRKPVDRSNPLQQQQTEIPATSLGSPIDNRYGDNPSRTDQEPRIEKPLPQQPNPLQQQTEIPRTSSVSPTDNGYGDNPPMGSTATEMSANNPLGRSDTFRNFDPNTFMAEQDD